MRLGSSGRWSTFYKLPENWFSLSNCPSLPVKLKWCFTKGETENFKEFGLALSRYQLLMIIWWNIWFLWSGTKMMWLLAASESELLSILRFRQEWQHNVVYNLESLLPAFSFIISTSSSYFCLTSFNIWLLNLMHGGPNEWNSPMFYSLAICAHLLAR